MVLEGGLRQAVPPRLCAKQCIAIQTTREV
jgi:hypothetical protein